MPAFCNANLLLFLSRRLLKGPERRFIRAGTTPTAGAGVMRAMAADLFARALDRVGVMMFTSHLPPAARWEALGPALLLALLLLLVTILLYPLLSPRVESAEGST